MHLNDKINQQYKCLYFNEAFIKKAFTKDKKNSDKNHNRLTTWDYCFTVFIYKGKLYIYVQGISLST